jgi:hypothetical protein
LQFLRVRFPFRHFRVKVGTYSAVSVVPKGVDFGTGLYSPTGYPKRCVFGTAGGSWKRGFWHTRDGLLQTSKKPTPASASPPCLNLPESAVTVTISLVTNRKHAARMALQKRFSQVRKQFVDC